MKIKRRWSRNLPPSLLIIAGLLALPVALPYACVSHGLRQRRIRAAAQRQRCPSCGNDLGEGAVHAADEYFYALRAEQFKANIGLRLRLAERAVHAICTACGTHLRFIEAPRSFEPV